MAGMLEYKCPCCDGAIQFDSATQKMKCPYCDTEFDVDTLKGYDEELKAFADAGREVVFVGDCNTKIGTLYHAVHTAHEAASVL